MNIGPNPAQDPSNNESLETLWKAKFNKGEYPTLHGWNSLPDFEKGQVAYVFTMFLTGKFKSAVFSPIAFREKDYQTYEHLLKAGLFHFLKIKANPKLVLKLIKDHGAKLDWTDDERSLYPFDYVITHQRSEKLFKYMLKHNAPVCVGAVSHTIVTEALQDKKWFYDCFMQYHKKQIDGCLVWKEDGSCEFDPSRPSLPDLRPLSCLIACLVRSNDLEYMNYVFNDIKDHYMKNILRLIVQRMLVKEEGDIRVYSSLSLALLSRQLNLANLLVSLNADLTHIQLENPRQSDFDYFMTLLVSEELNPKYIELLKNIQCHLGPDKMFELLDNFSKAFRFEWGRLSARPFVALQRNLNWSQKFVLFNSFPGPDATYCCFEGNGNLRGLYAVCMDREIVDYQFYFTADGQGIEPIFSENDEIYNSLAPTPEVLTWIVQILNKPCDERNSANIKNLNNERKSLKQIEEEFGVCSLSKQIPDMPVLLDGKVYEFMNLVKLPANQTGERQNPLTSEPFILKDIYPALEYQAKLDNLFQQQALKTHAPLLFQGHRTQHPAEPIPDGTARVTIKREAP